MPYIDTQNHFRIWFSSDQNVFLNQENQLRMVKFRADNPNAKMRLIYSSSLLTKVAEAELKDFCFMHKVEPIDFSSELLPKTENDEKLYDIAKKEIIAFRENLGGNLAAASDAARFMTDLIEHGIYSDFDTEIKVKNLTAQVDCTDGILLNCYNAFQGMWLIPMLNNDIIAVSKENGIVSSIAKEELLLYQTCIIDAYKSDVFSVIKKLQDCVTLNILYKRGHFEILEKIDPNMNIMQFRYYIEQAMTSVFGCLRFDALLAKRISKILIEKKYEKLALKLTESLKNKEYNNFSTSFTDDDIKIIKSAFVEENKKMARDLIYDLKHHAIGSSEARDNICRHAKLLLDINDADELVAKQLENKDHISVLAYKESVTYFSGPGSLIGKLIIDRLMNGAANLIAQRSLHNHSILKGAFVSSQPANKISTSTHKTQSDLSWTKNGIQRVKVREEGMEKAAAKIQKKFRERQNRKNDHLLSKSSPKIYSGTENSSDSLKSKIPLPPRPKKNNPVALKSQVPSRPPTPPRPKSYKG